VVTWTSPWFIFISGDLGFALMKPMEMLLRKFLIFPYGTGIAFWPLPLWGKAQYQKLGFTVVSRAFYWGSRSAETIAFFVLIA